MKISKIRNILLITTGLFIVSCGNEKTKESNKENSVEPSTPITSEISSQEQINSTNEDIISSDDIKISESLVVEESSIENIEESSEAKSDDNSHVGISAELPWI